MPLFANSHSLSRATTSGLLFGRLSHGHHIPDHLTAGCTLEHANVTLLPADFLVKAFEQIGCAHQRHVSFWKVYRQITQGLLKAVQKNLNRLGLALGPLVLKGLGASAN